MPTDKRATSYRLSDEARRLIDWLAKKLAVSRSSCVELAVRDLAKKEKSN